MALEKLVEDLIAALKENTAVTKDLMTMRADAIETVQKAAAPAAKATKPTAAPAAAPAAAAAPTAAPAAAATNVAEELAGMIAEYVGGATREEERAARKDKVKLLLQHDAIKKPGTPADVFDTANIRDDAIQTFKDNMAALIAKGDLTAPAASTSLV